jgi:hypothetical protein
MLHPKYLLIQVVEDGHGNEDEQVDHVEGGKWNIFLSII